MRRFLLALSCVIGFTSCEIEHHDHKAPTPPPSDVQPMTPERPNGPSVNR